MLKQLFADARRWGRKVWGFIIFFKWAGVRIRWIEATFGSWKPDTKATQMPRLIWREELSSSTTSLHTPSSKPSWAVVARGVYSWAPTEVSRFCDLLESNHHIPQGYILHSVSQNICICLPGKGVEGRIVFEGNGSPGAQTLAGKKNTMSHWSLREHHHQETTTHRHRRDHRGGWGNTFQTWGGGRYYRYSALSHPW